MTIILKLFAIFNDFSIYVLQDLKTEIKSETEEWKEIEIKHEALPTLNLVPSVKKEEVSRC